MQDATAGISINQHENAPDQIPGHAVEVDGVSGPGMFAPVVIADSVRDLGVGSFPRAKVFDVVQLMTGQQDSQWISVRGVVQSVQIRKMQDRPVLRMRVDSPTGLLWASVLDYHGDFDRLVDSEVVVTGVCGTTFNENGQLVGVRLFIPSLAGVVVEKPSPADPYSVHLQSLANLFRFGQTTVPNHRIRVRGAVTYQKLGEELYIQEAAHGIAIRTKQQTPVHLGDVVEAIGFAMPGGFSPVLADSMFRVTGTVQLIAPRRVDARQMIVDKDGFRESPRDGSLVTVQGQLVDSVKTAREQELLLQQGSTVFIARIEGDGGTAQKLLSLEPNTALDVTGVANVQMDQGDDPNSFQILLRSFDDVRVVKAAAWWNTGRVLYALEGTGLITAIAFLVILFLRRRLQRQSWALLESERIFRETLENIPLLALGLNNDGRVIFCNDASLTALGRTKDELVGKRWDFHFVSPNCADESTPLLAMSGHSPVRARHENYIHAKSGEKRFISWYNTLLHDSSGKTIGTVSIGEDITQRREAEEKMIRHSEAAEAANQAKSEFLAHMSHEIRTPMNGIIGMTNLVLESELTADQRENLDMVKVSAESLMTVINDILDFSKIEAGKLTLDPIPFNLEDALWETLRNVSVTARQKGLDLTSQIGKGVPVDLIGDPGRLRQVLLNLLGNAVKFTKTGGVTLQTEVEESREEEVTLHFCVADTGIGMSPEQKAKVFRAFEQAEISVSRQFGGTGLGLTISARLVEMFGGRIWVESERQRGSQFHFTARFHRAKLPTVAGVGTQLAGVRVLVVSSHSATRQMVEQSLLSAEARTHSVESRMDALEELNRAAASGSAYELLVVDLDAPSNDGFGLAREVREGSGYQNTKIIVLSSTGQRGDALICKELGIEGYLSKPFKTADLHQCMTAVVEATPGSSTTQLVTRHTLREARRRILLAEDNTVNQRLAVRLLEQHGHTVVVASNGKEALDAWAGDPFDLILMDVEMPVLDGFQATAAIRAAEQGGRQRTRIVAMTAHAMKGDNDRCVAAGMDGYLAKPIHAYDLYALLLD